MIYNLLIVILTIVFVIAIIYIYKTIYTSENFNTEIKNEFISSSFFHFDRIENDENKRILAINDKNKYIFIISKFNQLENKMDFPMQLPYLVYYKDNASLELFKIVCKIANIEMTNILFEKSDENGALKKQASVYVSLLNNDEFSKIKKMQGIRFFNYSSIDVRKLQHMIPYAYFTYSDVSPSKDIFKFIKFDECIYQNNRKYKEHDLKTDALVKNFYSMLGFKILENKKVRFSEEITVQTYIKDGVTITADKNIKGKITKMIKDQYIEFIALEDIDNNLKTRIKLGDVIILKNQTYDIENNKYYYIGDNKLVTSYPLVADTSKIYKDKNVIEYSSKDIYYINMFDRVYFTNIDTACIVMKKYIESDMINIICKPVTEDVEEFMDYECVTNRNIRFKDQCESSYDLSGNKKTRFDVWDKRCKYHTDCPFFNLENYKGGCNENGYCQMPLGVENIGYRKYTTGTMKSDCPYKEANGLCVF